MKIGDRYYCIKDRYDSENKLVHATGKSYKILEIGTNMVTLEVENVQPDNHFFYVFISVDNFYYCFWDYFITTQEARKFKLKNLNEYAGQM